MKSNQLLFSVAALSLAGIAGAGTRATPEVRSVVVKNGDLNLATQTDVARLHKQLRNAAKSVRSPLDSHMPGQRDGYEACVSDASASAIAAVGEKSAVLASN